MNRNPVFFALCLTLGLVLSSKAFAAKDTFALLSGQSVKGELVGLYNGYVFVDMGGGKRSSIPYGALDDASKALVVPWLESYLTSLKEESPSLKDVDTKLASFLSGNLVRLAGEELVEFDSSEAKQAEFYAFYYSAHWCGPCRRFTPKLVAFYNAMKRSGHDFEIVFVSSDESAKKMKAYMQETQMPWPALAFNKCGNKLVSQYEGSGIPCLVVTDKDGHVLFHSYVNGEYVGPTDVMKKLEAVLQQTAALKRKFSAASES